MARKFFLNVSKGKFFEKDQPGQNAHSFTEITGHLVNVVFKTIPQGQVMRLHVVDDLNFYILSMFVDSRPANAFFLLAKNLDLSIAMTFKIEAKDGKDFFAIHQFGGPVRWFYTSENAYELPSSTEDRKEFFIKILHEEIVPKLQKKINPYPNHLLYKPATKGIAGGYFRNESVYVKSSGGSGREGEEGFGKSFNRW